MRGEPETKKFELANVRGLDMLIGQLAENSLEALVERNGRKLLELQKRIEHLTATDDDKDRLRGLYDKAVCAALERGIRELPTLAQLRQQGKEHGKIASLQKALTNIVLTFHDFPIFDAVEKNKVLIQIYNLLRDKNLLEGPEVRIRS
jgi:hypothetical protein